MNKRMRELQVQILELTNTAKGYMAEGEGKDLDKAEATLNQRDELQKEFDLLVRTEAESKAGVPTDPVPNGGVDSVKALADAARARFKGMSEGVAVDGGYTVPEDIRTQINHFKEQRFSLATLIDSEGVTTKSGRRTYKARAQHTGFAQVNEGGAITAVATPKFSVISYDIKKYAGYLPVTNELLEDSDAAIANTIVEWLGEEEVATENAQILAKIKTKAATAIAGIDDIKKAVNVTLAAFAGSVRIVTNSDGLQYLDTLKDSNERPLLSPDPKEPMALRLSVGARSIPLVVVPNEVLPTSETGAIPFIIGDLREYMKEFDRKQLTLTVSDVAVAGDFNAFENDMTLFRGIMRADFVVKDDKAIVRGELTPAGV